MNTKLGLIACACLLAVVGCKPKSSIVGEWAGTEPSLMGTTVDVSAKFNADGTYSLSTGSGQTAMVSEGTYTYDDATKKLTLNQAHLKMAGTDVIVTQGSIAGPGAPIDLTWPSADEIKGKFGMQEADLKRK